MASRTVATLKFVGTVSLGLLTGLSYTLSTLTVPALLTLPTAATASRAFTNLSDLSLTHIQSLAGISSTSFVLAYFLSPRSQKHPYLLWTTLFVASSTLADIFLPGRKTNLTKLTEKAKTKAKDIKGKGKARQMDSSYEVLSGTSDRESEGTLSGEEMEAELEAERVNGEEVRQQMVEFISKQVIRTVVVGVGFAMSVLGIWGDGASDVVIIEM